MNLTPLQSKILDIVWGTGGYAFGGTARDIIRGELPNDLDIRLGHDSNIVLLRNLGANIEEDRAANHGEAYYDKKLVFSTGEQVHIKYGFVSVTDCDINLVKLYRQEVKLLYVPTCLQLSKHPLAEVLTHITRKEFLPLAECEPHRTYRWKEFEDRGWRKII